MSESAFGSLLRELRLSADLTLEGLSERSLVSERTISDIERGVSVAPRRSTVDALAAALELDGTGAQEFLNAARLGRKARYVSRAERAIAPHRVNDFVGREREVESVLGLLTGQVGSQSSARSVVICGAPGVGKTTVAWEAVGRESSRWASTLFVNLDGFGASPLSQLEVLTELLRQLQGGDERAPTSVAEAFKRLRAATDTGATAIVLDNAGTESQVRPVLGLGPHNAIIVTSRRTLPGLECSGRVMLSPLARAESVALLEQLMPERQREPASLDGLAELCDDIPLALRIAGNRIASRPTWSAADYLSRLRAAENRLELLVAGDLAVEAAFRMSYEQMEPATAQLFRAISVIDGGPFDAQLAAAIEDADVDDTESRLEDLLDLGVLEARGADRYLLHDLLRQFAIDRLRAEDGARGVVDRRDHLRNWLLRTLERAGAWFEPDRPSVESGAGSVADSESAERWIKSEAGHWWSALQDAAAQGEHAIVVDTADALHWFSDLWVHWGHWHELFQLAVDSARALEDDLMEATHLGYVAWSQIVESDDFAGARDTALAAVDAARSARSSTQLGWARYYLAWAYRGLGEYDLGATAAAASVAAFREARTDDEVALATSMLASLMELRGAIDEAISELLALQRHLAERMPANPTVSRQVAWYTAHKNLLAIYLGVGRVDEAIASADAALEVATTLGDKFRMSSILNKRGTAFALAGDDDAAQRDRRAAAELLGPQPTGTHAVEALRRAISS